VHSGSFAMTDWVYCLTDKGYRHEEDGVSPRLRHFRKNAVGILRGDDGEMATVWLIGLNETWNIGSADVEAVDVLKTGDKWPKKICNICHSLLAVDSFEPNQNNKHGRVRRPTCRPCRTDIDKRAPKTRQARQAETGGEETPEKGGTVQMSDLSETLNCRSNCENRS